MPLGVAVFFVFLTVSGYHFFFGRGRGGGKGLRDSSNLWAHFSNSHQYCLLRFYGLNLRYVDTG